MWSVSLFTTTGLLSQGLALQSYFNPQGSLPYLTKCTILFCKPWFYQTSPYILLKNLVEEIGLQLEESPPEPYSSKVDDASKKAKQQPFNLRPPDAQTKMMRCKHHLLLLQLQMAFPVNMARWKSVLPTLGISNCLYIVC